MRVVRVNTRALRAVANEGMKGGRGEVLTSSGLKEVRCADISRVVVGAGAASIYSGRATVRYGEGPALSRFEVNRDRELSEGKATSGRGFDREGGEEAYGQWGCGDRLDLQPSSTSTTSRTYTATMTHGRSGANVKRTVAEREQRARARDGRASRQWAAGGSTLNLAGRWAFGAALLLWSDN